MPQCPLVRYNSRDKRCFLGLWGPVQAPDQPGGDARLSSKGVAAVERSQGEVGQGIPGSGMMESCREPRLGGSLDPTEYQGWVTAETKARKA
jgi:hypothetical protein